MYNTIKTIISVLIIATFKFVLVFGNSEIVLASSRFTSNYSCSDTGKVSVSGALKLMRKKGDLAEIAREILEGIH